MAPKVMGEKDGELVQLFGWDTEAAGKEYSEFLHQFLAALKSELVKLGISEVTYFHISDEPSQEQFDSYKAAKEVVEKDLEGYQMMDALSDYEFYERSGISAGMCSQPHSAIPGKTSGEAVGLLLHRSVCGCNQPFHRTAGLPYQNPGNSDV